MPIFQILFVCFFFLLVKLSICSCWLQSRKSSQDEICFCNFHSIFSVVEIWFLLCLPAIICNCFRFNVQKCCEASVLFINFSPNDTLITSCLTGYDVTIKCLRCTDCLGSAVAACQQQKHLKIPQLSSFDILQCILRWSGWNGNYLLKILGIILLMLKCWVRGKCGLSCLVTCIWNDICLSLMFFTVQNFIFGSLNFLCMCE